MDNEFQYIINRLDFITSTVSEIKVQTTKTNGSVIELQNKQKLTDQEMKNIKSDLKLLQEDRHIEKGKAKVINLLIGGAGAVVFAIIEYLIQLYKFIK